MAKKGKQLFPIPRLPRYRVNTVVGEISYAPSLPAVALWRLRNPALGRVREAVASVVTADFAEDLRKRGRRWGRRTVWRTARRTVRRRVYAVAWTIASVVTAPIRLFVR